MESSHFLALPAALCGLVQMLRESALSLLFSIPHMRGSLASPRKTVLRSASRVIRL